MNKFFNNILKYEWNKLQKIREEIENLEKKDSSRYKHKLEQLEKEKEELEQKIKSNENLIRKKIYNELVNYYHPDKKNTSNMEKIKDINNAYKLKNDIELFHLYKEYQELKNQTSNISFRDISISFDREDIKFQQEKLDEIDIQLKYFNKVKINGNEYVLNQQGYLEYKNPKYNGNKTLHRRVARDYLYNEKNFPNLNFSQLEVHHIKSDQKLNCFTNNLVILTKAEHSKLHKEYLEKYSPEDAVKKILKERGF